MVPSWSLFDTSLVCFWSAFGLYLIPVWSAFGLLLVSIWYQVGRPRDVSGLRVCYLGSTRFVVDYRKLNSFTIRDRYPLPRLDESIESFFGARYFSTLDLLSGYHQIEVDESDKPKTAFTSEFGHYEYNRMPFGLTNAPATFQRLMNFILQDLLYKTVVVYLDDIIIFSKNCDTQIKLKEMFIFSTISYLPWTHRVL